MKRPLRDRGDTRAYGRFSSSRTGHAPDPFECQGPEDEGRASAPLRRVLRITLLSGTRGRDDRFRRLGLAVGAACGLSLHAIGVTEPRFSRSIRKPGRASRRLHAGCRSGCIRHPPSSSRRKGHPPVLTSPNPPSTLHRRFTCARLSRPCLSGSSSRRFRKAHNHGS
jgi:hypothetical protein